MSRRDKITWEGAEMVGRPKRDDVAFVNSASALWGDESPDIGYQARVFAQTSLPYRDPGSLTVWGRRNGALSLVVQPGHDIDQNGMPVSAGFPFGVIPRLLLTWISTEAVRMKEPVLPLGDSLSDFMGQLGLVPTGGKVGSITRLREQMRRLFKASIAVRYSEHDPETGLVRDAGRQSMIAAEYDLWWSSRAPLNSQPSLLPSYVRLTTEFYEEVTSRPVPVSLDALRLLRGSPLRLDIYAWLTYRMSYLRRPTKVPWDGLSLQFGSNHASTRQGRHNFRSDFERHLRYVLAVYPDAKVDVDSSGLLLRPSKTHVGRGARPAINGVSQAPQAPLPPAALTPTPTCAHGGQAGRMSSGNAWCPQCRHEPAARKLHRPAE